MNIDPVWIKSNTGGQCKDICDKNGNKIHFEFLTKSKKYETGEYLYVIREAEPNLIYVYHFANIQSDNDYLNPNNFKEYSCNGNERKTVHHTCLALDRNVICAGTLKILPKKKVILSNISGHYLPSVKCLDYVTYLLNKLEFKVIDIEFY